ncbi:MAG: AAA family ATPase, partial [Victivallaceae bacterium]
MSGGRRQFVISGEIGDYFMLSMFFGVQDLRSALKKYLPSRGFEVVVFINSADKIEFLTLEMEQIFNDVTRNQNPSSSKESPRNITTPPANSGSERGKGHLFVPRGARTNNNSSAVPTEKGGNTSSASPREAQAQAALTQVGRVAENMGETLFLERVGRLLASPIKTAVVYFHPENLWLGQPEEKELRKLESILRWSAINSGNPGNASILVVNPSRLEEFNLIADQRFNRSNFTRNIVLGKPGRKELEAFLIRFACRHEYGGTLDKIASTAYAKHLSLYNFSELIREYLVNNPQVHNLDGIFSDAMQAKTLTELYSEINALIGMQAFKEEVHKISAEVQFSREQRRRGVENSSLNYHLFLLGNPGSGKTLAARLLGQLFWALELRQLQNIVEISFADIISSFNEGETVGNMRKKIDEAAGGVLFVDEFYLFCENEWGRKALEVLMKEMEDKSDNFTVIMAGYEERLPELFKINPGFRSRINRVLNFPDYSVDELMQMFNYMAEKNHVFVAGEASAKLQRYFESFHNRGGVGNGRGVRNVLEKVIGVRALRQAADNVIIANDIPEPVAFR